MSASEFRLLSRPEFRALTIEQRVDYLRRQMEYMQHHMARLREQLAQTKREVRAWKKVLSEG